MRRNVLLLTSAALAVLLLAEVTQAQIVDSQAPVTTIDSAPLGEIVDMPDGSSRMIVNSSTATFTFHANTGTSEGPLEPDATFECKLDEGSYEPCTSPQTYTDLPAGQHLFLVRAIDTVGNIGDPAGWNWYIDLPDSPPMPTIKEQCKDGGYKDFSFENQGQCIKAVNSAA